MGRWLVWDKMSFKDRLDGADGAVRGWDNGTESSGDEYGAPPLALKMRRVAGSSECHHFHRRCGGHRVFFSVQKENKNTLYTDLNCKIVQDSTKITYDVTVLQNTKNCMKKENSPRKKSQKTAEIKIGDLHP